MLILLTQRDGIADWCGHLIAQIRDGIVTHIRAPHLVNDGLAEVQVLQHGRYIDAAVNENDIESDKMKGWAQVRLTSSLSSRSHQANQRM